VPGASVKGYNNEMRDINQLFGMNFTSDPGRFDQFRNTNPENH
jgi:hypothetical protein